MASLAAQILDALPQTQCTRCGYPDCEAYASAIAADGVPINQCPPGGAQGVERLAAITGRPALPLNPDNGLEGPRTLAVIDEAWCIGCTLCIKACPTDAIVGSNKRMHTVIEALLHGLRIVHSGLSGRLHRARECQWRRHRLGRLVASSGGAGAYAVCGFAPAARTASRRCTGACRIGRPAVKPGADRNRRQAVATAART